MIQRSVADSMFPKRDYIQVKEPRNVPINIIAGGETQSDI